MLFGTSGRTVDALREALNAALETSWREWEVPREAGPKWPGKSQKLHGEWWQARIARQKEIDKSIAAKAEFEYLYDKPHEDRRSVRVPGPFTVKSLSPHRTLAVGAKDELIDPFDRLRRDGDSGRTFAEMILDDAPGPGNRRIAKKLIERGC
jgi:adenine-specific DNA-methyltransferase